MPAKRPSKKKPASNPEGTDRSGMVRRDLDDEESQQKGEELAAVEVRLRALRESLSEHKARENKKIRELEDRVAVLSQEIDDGCVWVDGQLAIPGADR